jgi:hypothetical protein
VSLTSRRAAAHCCEVAGEHVRIIDRAVVVDLAPVSVRAPEQPACPDRQLERFAACRKSATLSPNDPKHVATPMPRLASISMEPDSADEARG